MSTGPIPTPFGQKLRRARVGAMPLLIWLAGVSAALNLWLSGPSSSTYHGLAHAVEVQMSSPADGELKEFLVELFQTVRAGEPLASLDDSALNAQIETARAELRQLAAEHEAQRADMLFEDEAARLEATSQHEQSVSIFALEFPAELRAFHSDETVLKLSILETQLEITASELEANRLEIKLHRLEALAADDLAKRADVEDLAKRLEVAVARVTSLQLLEASQGSELELERQRRRALEASFDGPPLASLADPQLEARLAGWRAAILVQEKRLDELALQREAFVLRAPAAGRVAGFAASAGQHLLAGDPVLVLVDARSSEVALWVPESSPAPASLGDRFLVKHRIDRETEAVAECVVLALSPRVEPLPERLWRDARVAEYGRQYLLGPTAALNLVPGELVQIDPLSGVGAE